MPAALVFAIIAAGVASGLASIWIAALNQEPRAAAGGCGLRRSAPIWPGGKPTALPSDAAANSSAAVPTSLGDDASRANERGSSVTTTTLGSLPKSSMIFAAISLIKIFL
jgi:hypothetical protein